MTVAFTTYFIEPQRNSEKNACSGAADLGDPNNLFLATSIAILGVEDATLPANLWSPLDPTRRKRTSPLY